MESKENLETRRFLLLVPVEGGRGKRKEGVEESV
jgi:hypothetical protein